MHSNPNPTSSNIKSLIARRDLLRMRLERINAQIALEVRKDRIAHDPWMQRLRDTVKPPHAYTTAALMDLLGVPDEHRSQHAVRRICHIMRTLKWSAVVTKTEKRRSIRAWKFFAE